jgi:hypothetical protein
VHIYEEGTQPVNLNPKQKRAVTAISVLGGKNRDNKTLVSTGSGSSLSFTVCQKKGLRKS